MDLTNVAKVGTLAWVGIELATAAFFAWRRWRDGGGQYGEDRRWQFYEGPTKQEGPAELEGPVVGDTVLFFDNMSPQCFTRDHDIDRCRRARCAPRNMKYITKLLESAKTSIDVCMYVMTNDYLSSSLQKAIKNGVKVRLFCNADHRARDESTAILRIRDAGAFVRCKEYNREDQRDHLLMHHKFVVIDGKLLITGSLNWTMMATSGNWEDAAILTEPSIVKKFVDEFQYLWDNFNTPEDALPTPPNPPVFPHNFAVWKETPYNEVFMFREDTARCRAHMSSMKFSLQPESHAPVCAYTVLRNLAKLLASAEKSIDVCLLLLNLENIADVLLNAFYNGIKVRMVADSHYANLTGSQIRTLINEGVKVRGKHYHSSMHHKFIILDGKLVVFGSFNWSMQALCGNSENLLCTNNSNIVTKFQEHFDELWGEFSPIEVEKIGIRNFSSP